MEKVSLNLRLCPYQVFRGAWLVPAGWMRIFGCVQATFLACIAPDPTFPAPSIRDFMKNPG